MLITLAKNYILTVNKDRFVMQQIRRYQGTYKLYISRLLSDN
jgi:hypothetical protein